jgi:hypothetical protein
MQTWSAVKSFSNKEKFNPLELIIKELENLWGMRETQKTVRWDINIRIGIIHG